MDTETPEEARSYRLFALQCSAMDYDVAVIGGGPAGMMAAGRAAELGARVVLLEKNPHVGKKLLITGGGRCNILHAEFDTHRLVERYGKKGKSLFSTFSTFDAQATWDFFEEHGLPLMVEAENRAFPQSERAEDVQRTLIAYMRAGNVDVRTGVTVEGIEGKDGAITQVIVDGEPLRAKHYILASGGKSHPETGSTGEGFLWARALGHTVHEPNPALVPLLLSDAWVSDVAGISMKDIRLSALQKGKKVDSRKGKMLFTHNGLSGPLVLNMSKGVGELLKEGPVELALDCFPSLDIGGVDALLLSLFDEQKNKQMKNTIGGVIQPRLGKVLLELAGIDGATPLYRLTREDRLAFARMLKGVPMHVSGLMGADKAIVTGGGIDLGEVEFKTMRSKKYANLYFAGDILDFDRPSGGFSLQICWTTGFVAGSDAALEKGKSGI